MIYPSEGRRGSIFRVDEPSEFRGKICFPRNRMEIPDRGLYLADIVRDKGNVFIVDGIRRIPSTDELKEAVPVLGRRGEFDYFVEIQYTKDPNVPLETLEGACFCRWAEMPEILASGHEGTYAWFYCRKPVVRRTIRLTPGDRYIYDPEDLVWYSRYIYSQAADRVEKTDPYKSFGHVFVDVTYVIEEEKTIVQGDDTYIVAPGRITFVTENGVAPYRDTNTYRKYWKF